MTKILHGRLDGIRTVSLNEKNNAYCKEYVRSKEFLFDSPTYLKIDVVANLTFFVNMCIIVIIIIAIS